MVFMVPDEPDERLETPQGATDAEPTPKAKLDDTEVSRASQKVDLDLDDAPFLEEEESEEEIPEEEPAAPPPELEEKPRKEPSKWLRNKLLIVGLLVGLLLGGGLFYFLSGSSTPPPPTTAETPPPAPAESAPEKQPEQPVPEEQPPGETLVRLDPFLIEQHDGENQIRFLEVSLVFSTPDPMLAANLTRETPTVRYALYYYMKNKDLRFLTDEKNTEALKKELLSVVNQYMSAGRFQTVLFEEYLVR